MQDKNVKSIASKRDDITSWYTDVCLKTQLMSYSTVKGFINYLPDSMALWDEIHSYLDIKFKQLGVKNVYLPSLIPLSLLNKEKDHVKGFSPECALVTSGGDKPLSEPLVVRPTSETLFCDLYKDLVHSYNDLPIKYNQWCSVVRWEKTTRPFLRGSEFLWQEGHTLHLTKDEAVEFALTILKIYQKMGEELLAIPFLVGQKTESEKFAGAINTYTLEAMMPDGQALQCGTTHYLGQGFSKAYDIKYLNSENKMDYPHYTSWGVSTRLLGALIMIHGDDEGLVLPPKIAPLQVVIIPIKADSSNKVLETCKKINDSLLKKNIRSQIDQSNKTPGWKFSQYEMKGIPIRIELGPKDLSNNQVTISKRFDLSKQTLSLEKLENNIVDILDEIQVEMYNKARSLLETKVFECHNKTDIDRVLKDHLGFAKIQIKSENQLLVEKELKEKYSATPRLIPFDQRLFQTDDSYTSQPGADKVLLFARAY